MATSMVGMVTRWWLPTIARRAKNKRIATVMVGWWVDPDPLRMEKREMADDGKVHTRRGIAITRAR
jgi:hypothetical protein